MPPRCCQVVVSIWLGALNCWHLLHGSGPADCAIWILNSNRTGVPKFSRPWHIGRVKVPKMGLKEAAFICEFDEEYMKFDDSGPIDIEKVMNKKNLDFPSRSNCRKILPSQIPASVSDDSKKQTARNSQSPEHPPKKTKQNWMAQYTDLTQGAPESPSERYEPLRLLCSKLVFLHQVDAAIMRRRA